jgi:hypothetical protein
MTAGPRRASLPVMKRILPAALAATAAAAAVAHGQTAPTTLHLVDHNTGFVFSDVKPKQLPKTSSPGDTLTISGKLTGDATGASHLICTVVVGGKKEQELCQGNAALPGGDLFFSGRLTPAATGSLAVTGGTGKYAGASGTIATRDGKQDTTIIDVTFSS